jgi:hypothetical protein
MAPKIKDGDIIGTKKAAPVGESVALLCDAQSTPKPTFRFDSQQMFNLCVHTYFIHRAALLRLDYYS